MNNGRGERFSLGKVSATPGVLCQVHVAEIQKALSRHHAGDWGDLSAGDSKLNDLALLDGSRLFSVYHSSTGVEFYVITEHDRSYTTVLLPHEY